MFATGSHIDIEDALLDIADVRVVTDRTPPGFSAVSEVFYCIQTLVCRDLNVGGDEKDVARDARVAL